MSANREPAGPHSPAAPRGLRDVLTCTLYLMLLTLSAGLMLDRAGIGRLVYPPAPTRSGHKDQDALMTAIENGNVASVRRLLRSARVDVNAADHLGATPIHYAVRTRGTASALIDVLIEAGADVNGRRGGRTLPPLVHVASLPRPDLIRQLLRAGADPNRSAGNGWTALHYAAMCDDAATATALLSAGANPLAADDEGHTPLDVASTYGARATAAVLTARAARP